MWKISTVLEKQRQQKQRRRQLLIFIGMHKVNVLELLIIHFDCFHGSGKVKKLCIGTSLHFRITLPFWWYTEMTFRCCFDRCIILLEDSSRQIQELCFPCYCMTCIICNLSTKRSHFKWQWELFWELDAFCFRCSGDLIHLPFLGAFLERDFMLLKKLFAEIWGRFRVLWFAWQQSVWEASLSNVALNTDISPKTHILRLLCLHPRFVSQPSSAFLGPWSLFWELLLWKSQQAKQKVSRYCSPLSATAPFCKQTHRPAVAVDSPQCQASKGTFLLPNP